MVLNTMVREGLTEEVTPEQRLEEQMEGDVGDSHSLGILLGKVSRGGSAIKRGSLDFFFKDFIYF